MPRRMMSAPSNKKTRSEISWGEGGGTSCTLLRIYCNPDRPQGVGSTMRNLAHSAWLIMHHSPHYHSISTEPHVGDPHQSTGTTMGSTQNPHGVDAKSS